MQLRKSKSSEEDKKSTVQYSTVQYSTVQYSTVQYSTVQQITASPTWPVSAKSPALIKLLVVLPIAEHTIIGRYP